jgi:hypothetical protein
MRKPHPVESSPESGGRSEVRSQGSMPEGSNEGVFDGHDRLRAEDPAVTEREGMTTDLANLRDESSGPAGGSVPPTSREPDGLGS